MCVAGRQEWEDAATWREIGGRGGEWQEGSDEREAETGSKMKEAERERERHKELLMELHVKKTKDVL